jgi:glycosyltransferase involved in cell wall biosynthesis
MKISLIQPSRNNLKYLKWSYDSIRKNQGHHEVEICIADDASTDGTWNWCQEMIKYDSNFKAIRNQKTERLGHTILYDRLVNEVATNDICMIYHADMYLCPGAIDAVEKYMKPKTIVSLTRIEPPLHPPGPEKILEDFGIEPEEFDEKGLLEFITNSAYEATYNGRTTEGIFAPWAFWKRDFQNIGGHDKLFAPQSKEDTDIFNRFHLYGIKFVQTWMGAVYHMTCRGSRFAEGAKRNPDGNVFMKNRETDEWLTQNQKSTREFIRKWGHFCKHDEYMKPIVPSKYNIAFRVKNCNLGLLETLEPWCDRIYSDANIKEYIDLEQLKTSFNLNKRCHSLTELDKKDYDDVLVDIDGSTFSNTDFMYIQQLPDIIKVHENILLEEDMGQEFEVGNLRLTINHLKTYEKDLIICKK